nr:hypothetical protein BaRGS_015448 [Batillaria attramentaria]
MTMVTECQMMRRDRDPLRQGGLISAQSLYVLFEHATGYGLFQVKEFDELALLAPRVEQSVSDLSKFNSVIKTVAFSPFKSGTNALDNMNSISEGVLHEDLKLFLETNLPKSSKKLKVVLGVGDAKIGAAINEELKINCLSTGVIPELLRGIRLHFHNLVKEGRLTEQLASKAQLGLGHSYSRAKVKFNVNRVDNMIIQSIALLDQLDKDINTFSMRIREWYSYHFPELVKVVPDNYMYARVVQMIKNRKELTPEMTDALEEVVMDSAKVQAIFDAARSSMDIPTSVFGDHLRQQVEDRLKFYETGEAPAKNLDVMRQAVTAATEVQTKILKKEKKRKKKEKLQQEDADNSQAETTLNDTMEVDGETPKKNKKDKKKRKLEESQADSTMNDTLEERKKEKKKKKKAKENGD